MNLGPVRGVAPGDALALAEGLETLMLRTAEPPTPELPASFPRLSAQPDHLASERAAAAIADTLASMAGAAELELNLAGAEPGPEPA